MLNSSDNMFNNSVIRWLCIILEERFGHHFNLGAEEGKWVLTLPNDPRRITFTADTKTFRRADSDLAHSVWNASAEGWTSVLGTPLPAPGAEYLSSPLITATAEGLHIDYDIFGLIYWMLTRQEEFGRRDLDSHGRFPAMSSHAYKHGYLERPIVDEWLDVLGQMIVRNWIGIQLKKHKFEIKVSHDVDRPSRYGFRNLRGLTRAIVADVWTRRDYKCALLAPWIRINTSEQLHPLDPFNTFDWIMDVSEKQGIKSSFYFICGRTELSRDADYEPEHPAIRDLMRRINKRGHEIGLHPSYGTYQQPSHILAEANRLRRLAAEESIEQAQWGGRMHYLRWDQQTTLRAMADAGMTYESTLAYADRPGFRCGTCFEYPAFDSLRSEVLQMRVRPLIVMECSVISESYLGLGLSDASFVKFNQLKKVCYQVGGVFTLLWHNSELDSVAKKNLYRDILIS